MALAVTLIYSYGNVGAVSGLIYFLAMLPFISDAIISGVTMTQGLRSTATVTEI